MVGGAVLVPGTAFVEMAVRAGQGAGCARVEDLTLEAPLAIPAHGGVQVQVSVAAPDQDGGVGTGDLSGQLKGAEHGRAGNRHPRLRVQRVQP